VRSFLGLTRYYRRFIRGYVATCRALTNLLKKDGFEWNWETVQAFKALKVALISAPMLLLPDFEL